MIARELLALPDYAEEVVLGLSSRPKRLPCKLLYDERGSVLFGQITELPEYYLTRTELGILRQNAHEISVAAGSPLSVIELGAGTATKTSVLLQAVAREVNKLRANLDSAGSARTDESLLVGSGSTRF